MRLLADSHAVLWYTQSSPRLSPTAASALTEAELGNATADEQFTDVARAAKQFASADG